MNKAILGIVGLATGVLWRVELEMRWGWASLDWIDSFHFAAPLGVALVLGWMAWVMRDLPQRSRIRLLAGIGLLGAIGYFAGPLAVTIHSSRWLGMMPIWQGVPMYLSPFIVYGALGVFYFGSIWYFVKPGRAGLVAGVILYVMALPIAGSILWMVNHRGGADLIHAFKSGFIFPPLVWALGMPLVTCRSSSCSTSP